MTHEQRVSLLRQAILQLQTIAVELLDAELFAAADEVARASQVLTKQHEMFVTLVPVAEGIRA